MPEPKCPFCLGIHDYKTSQFCIKHPDEPDYEVPAAYIDEYNRVPPLWLMTVGFKDHGKTCYLAALTIILENISKYIPGTSTMNLDSYTLRAIHEIRNQAITGEMPASTGPDQRPLLIHAYDMPSVDSNTLVLYDTPGELFETMAISDESDFLNFLKQIKNIWFIISLYDLQNKSGRQINDLLSFYINGMRKLGVPVSGRNLIVVYTKADLLLSAPEFNLPPDIQRYIRNDPFQSLTEQNSNTSTDEFEFEDYFEEMQLISDKLQEYTIETVTGGPAFVNLANRYKLGLHFSITSALGSSARNNILAIDAIRLRVIDPYLWALHLNQPETNSAICLVLDGGNGSEVVYEHAIRGFGEDLQQFGEVTTYFLGKSSPASKVNQAPPKNKPKIAFSRLLGPILNKIPSDALVIVFTAGRIVDLGDYQRTWENRMMIVACGEDEFQYWPNTIVLREGDKISLVFDELKQFFSENSIN
jgi:hypothetical protein